MYTTAFSVGAAIGWYNYYHRPGGRKDRDRLADAAREREIARELMEEETIREERRMKNKLMARPHPDDARVQPP